MQRPDSTWQALYTLTMTTEVCEELGLATVPREVTPGLRPAMEIAGVGYELIDWSSRTLTTTTTTTRRRRRRRRPPGPGRRRPPPQ
ncbi:hypothetical protein ACIQFZ_21325 [Streptomyces sp. NPDC093064]|uniref:hypothetical protein n=1 Tax=Streptomyces sp. NPDC093064 TaxID=3366020 RepID=UPI00382F23B0